MEERSEKTNQEPTDDNLTLSIFEQHYKTRKLMNKLTCALNQVDS